MMTMRGVLALLVTAQALMAQDTPTPVVLWHGMGDSAAGMVGIAVSMLCDESWEVTVKVHYNLYDRRGNSQTIWLLFYGVIVVYWLVCMGHVDR